MWGKKEGFLVIKSLLSSLSECKKATETSMKEGINSAISDRKYSLVVLWLLFHLFCPGHLQPRPCPWAPRLPGPQAVLGLPEKGTGVQNTQIVSYTVCAVYHNINHLLTRWSPFSRKSWKPMFCPGTWTPDKALFSNDALLTLNTPEHVCEWTGTVRSD